MTRILKFGTVLCIQKHTGMSHRCSAFMKSMNLYEVKHSYSYHFQLFPSNSNFCTRLHVHVATSTGLKPEPQKLGCCSNNTTYVLVRHQNPSHLPRPSMDSEIKYLFKYNKIFGRGTDRVPKLIGELFPDQINYNKYLHWSFSVY